MEKSHIFNLKLIFKSDEMMGQSVKAIYFEKEKNTFILQKTILAFTKAQVSLVYLLLQ